MNEDLVPNDYRNSLYVLIGNVQISFKNVTIPLVRRLANFNGLSEFDQVSIMELRKAIILFRQICNRIGRNAFSVFQVMNNWTTEQRQLCHIRY